MARDIRSRLEPFGINVLSAYLTDSSPCIVIETVGETPGPCIPPDSLDAEELGVP